MQLRLYPFLWSPKATSGLRPEALRSPEVFARLPSQKGPPDGDRSTGQFGFGAGCDGEIPVPTAQFGWMIYSSSLSKKARLARGGGPQRERDSGLRRSSRSGHIIPMVGRGSKKRGPPTKAGQVRVGRKRGPQGGLEAHPGSGRSIHAIGGCSERNAARGEQKARRMESQRALERGSWGYGIDPFRLHNPRGRNVPKRETRRCGRAPARSTGAGAGSKPSARTGN